MKIIFMGTSDFAVFSLKELIKEGYHVSLVVTMPDRKKGRGKKILPSPVKRAALAADLDIIQPESIADKAFEKIITRLKPDIFVVTSFGHILKKSILALPSIGAVNIHASLLPKYRGPSPINFAIINREKITGVTTMFMDEGVDTGNIIYSAQTPIDRDDTAETLHDRLASIGSKLLIRTLEGIADNKITPYPQDDATATYTTLLKKDDGNIDWNKSAVNLEAFIKGMNPWPSAFTYLYDKRFKIFNAKATDYNYSDSVAPGTVVYKSSDQLFVSTGRLVLSILEIQAASGKRLRIKDFLSGFSVSEGSLFSAGPNHAT